jgi:hypothetical protein
MDKAATEMSSCPETNQHESAYCGNLQGEKSKPKIFQDAVRYTFRLLLTQW